MSMLVDVRVLMPHSLIYGYTQGKNATPKFPGFLRYKEVDGITTARIECV
jgi:hypothetical protein